MGAWPSLWYSGQWPRAPVTTRSRYWERRVQPRREHAINSLRAAAAVRQVNEAGDADLLIDMLAGLLLYRYFLTPQELRDKETDEQWLDRVVNLSERLLAPLQSHPPPP